MIPYRFLLQCSLEMTAALVLTACGGRSTPLRCDSTVQPAAEEEIVHADNDIAMTVCSMADAIRVGQPLLSDDYDFKGVLTDGMGRPLYTDLDGAPGEWVVEVNSPTSVTLRNLHLGDLLPGDLRDYLLSALGVDAVLSQVTTEDDLPGPEDEMADISVYDFGGGYIRFEVRNHSTGSGMEYPFLAIALNAPPEEKP